MTNGDALCGEGAKFIRIRRILTLLVSFVSAERTLGQNLVSNGNFETISNPYGFGKENGGSSGVGYYRVVDGWYTPYAGTSLTYLIHSHTDLTQASTPGPSYLNSHAWTNNLGPSPSGGNYILGDGFNAATPWSSGKMYTSVPLMGGQVYELTFNQALVSWTDQPSNGVETGQWYVSLWNGDSTNHVTWEADASDIGGLSSFAPTGVRPGSSDPSVTSGNHWKSDLMSIDASVPTADGWSPTTVRFTAEQTGDYYLMFNAVSSGVPVWAGLDGVVLTAIPEPMSASLVAGVGIALLFRRSRKAATG